MGLFSVPAGAVRRFRPCCGPSAHEVEGPASVFSPRARRARGLKRPHQPPAGWRGGHLGAPLAAHRIVSAFHKVPQQLAHLRLQAHPASPPRVPAGRGRPSVVVPGPGGARLATPTPSHPGIGSPHAPDAGPWVPRLALPVSLGSGRRPPRTGAPRRYPRPRFPTSRGCDGSASNRCRHRRIAVRTCPSPSPCRRYSTRGRADAGRRECARASTAGSSSPCGDSACTFRPVPAFLVPFR